MFEYKSCPHCNSNKNVEIRSHANSYYCKVFFVTYCNSQECKDKWWPQDMHPLSTKAYETQEEARDAWNNGNVVNNRFAFFNGGHWTGD